MTITRTDGIDRSKNIAALIRKRGYEANVSAICRLTAIISALKWYDHGGKTAWESLTKGYAIIREEEKKRGQKNER